MIYELWFSSDKQWKSSLGKLSIIIRQHCSGYGQPEAGLNSQSLACESRNLTSWLSAWNTDRPKNLSNLIKNKSINFFVKGMPKPLEPLFMPLKFWYDKLCLILSANFVLSELRKKKILWKNRLKTWKNGQCTKKKKIVKSSSIKARKP